MVASPRRLTVLRASAADVEPVNPSSRRAALRLIARRCSVAAVVVAILLGTWLVGLTLYGLTHADRIYEGVSVAGLSVGGMAREDAALAIQAHYDRYAETPFATSADGGVYPLTASDIGASLDLQATLDETLSYGRDGSFWKRSIDWGRALIRGSAITMYLTIDESVLTSQLSAIADDIDRVPKNATVEMSALSSPTLIADQNGVEVDSVRSEELLRQQLRRLSSEPIDLPTNILSAGVLSSALQGSLPSAQSAVSQPFILSAAEESWTISPATLKSIVSVADDGTLTVDLASLERTVASVAAEVNRLAVDSAVVIGEDASIIAIPGSYSAFVDQAETVNRVVAALTGGEHEIRVAIARQPAAITDGDVALAIADAESLVGDGINLTWKDGEVRLERADIVRALVIEPKVEVDGLMEVRIDRDQLAAVLIPVTQEVDIAVRDASFRLIDGVVTLVQKDRRGRTTDSGTSVETIIQALYDGEDVAELAVVRIDPEISADALGEIALPDFLGDSYTYYGNSSEPRRQNVERAVDLESGWLVPPGGIFSYVERIGDITEETGFATGFGIVADGDTGNVTTAPVIGGGICQVSTTIYQAAFWAGMEIVERWQHPYWLTSYGQPPRGMKGLDAMVNVEDDWALDMKFRNTTDDWIAVVVMYDSQNVTAQILGTDPGWEIDVDDVVISNVVPKDDKMYFTESPELQKGQELVVESAAEGFDTSIKRTVLMDGEIIDQYVVTSTFAPSRNTTLRGTG